MREVLFILLLIAAGQGFFLAVFLVAHFKKYRSNLYLGAMFLFFSLQLFDLVLLSSGKATDYPHLAFWSAPLNLAFGPLLYLFINSQKTGKTSWEDRQLLHLLPFLLHLAYTFWLYHLQPLTVKTAFIQEFVANRLHSDGLSDLSGITFTVFIYLQFGFYLWLSNQSLKQSSAFSKDVHRLLKWLWLAVAFIGLFGLAQVVLFVLRIDQEPATGYLASLLAVLYIYSGALLLLKRPQIIFPAKEKYGSSTLDRNMGLNLLDKLRTHMDQAKPYRDQEFNLKQLAASMKVPERHISQVINEQLGQHFSDFVNEYRIEAFKNMVSDASKTHLSLLGMAMECGFKSKSTFNTVFKRLTGQTPSEFKRQTSEVN